MDYSVIEASFFVAINPDGLVGVLRRINAEIRKWTGTVNNSFECKIIVDEVANLGDQLIDTA